jgi:hypothetical protein
MSNIRNSSDNSLTRYSNETLAAAAKSNNTSGKSSLAFRNAVNDPVAARRRISTFNIAFEKASGHHHRQTYGDSASQDILDAYCSSSLDIGHHSPGKSPQHYTNIVEVTAAAVLNERMKRNSQYTLNIPFNASRRFTTAVDQQDKFFNMINQITKVTDHRKSFSSFDRNRIEQVSFSENNQEFSSSSRSTLDQDEK